jgi:hypothetical protein
VNPPADNISSIKKHKETLEEEGEVNLEKLSLCWYLAIRLMSKVVIEK